jgi:hypothetical protein
MLSFRNLKKKKNQQNFNISGNNINNVKPIKVQWYCKVSKHDFWMYRNKRQHANYNFEIYRHKSQIRNAQHIQHNKYINANNNNQWFEI